MASKIESEAKSIGQMVHDLIDDINNYAVQYEEIVNESWDFYLPK